MTTATGSYPSISLADARRTAARRDRFEREALETGHARRAPPPPGTAALQRAFLRVMAVVLGSALLVQALS